MYAPKRSLMDEDSIASFCMFYELLQDKNPNCGNVAVKAQEFKTWLWVYLLTTRKP